MSVKFKNPPVLEIIAELKWNDGSPRAVPLFMNNSPEEFFMRFGGAAYSLGYQHAERIVPAGFPLQHHMPVYRYKKTSDSNLKTLYQVGPGLFSANALPPYETWKEFSPIIEKGIEILLSTRGENEKNIEFENINLRYINGFKRDILKDKNTIDFLNDVLGIKLILPAPITKHIAPKESIKPVIQFETLLPNDYRLNFTAGDAIVNSDNVCLADITVTKQTKVAANLKASMAVLNEAHDIINDVFFNLTTKIHSELGIQK